MREDAIRERSVIDILKEMIAQRFDNQDNEKYSVEPYNVVGVYLKNLFFAQSISLHFFDEELFKEPIEAWKLGPVVASVRTTFVDEETKKDLYRTTSDRKIDSFSSYIVSVALEITQGWSFDKLVDYTHQPGGAWQKHYVVGVNRIIIPNEDIKNCFSAHKDIFEKAKELLTHTKYYDKQFSTEKYKDQAYIDKIWARMQGDIQKKSGEVA
jgi:uncharacterized phage-associated protein